MVNYICTRFKDSDGLDLGCHLIPKEYLLEKYPAIQEWVKAPALWVWGSNYCGVLGTGNFTFTSSPVQTISTGTNWRSATSGTNHRIGIKTDGTLWSWGFQNRGSLGNDVSTTTYMLSPVQTIVGGNTWASASAETAKTAAIKTDGTLWLWGYGNGGALGNNSIVNISAPIQTISQGTNWKKVSIGRHTAAIKTDGTLWVWGCNSGAALGIGVSITSKSTPVQTISGGTNWKSVSIGSFHTTAIKTDGTLWTWGVNSFGVLGTNSTVAIAYSPGQTVSNVNTWKQVNSGDRHIAAIKTDGTLWLWGRACWGSLGNNCVLNTSSPVQTVSGGTNWFSVSARGFNTAAIKTDGTLWIWGNSANGTHGDNTTINRSSPVQTISAGTDWRSVNLGANHVAAIKDEGDF